MTSQTHSSLLDFTNSVTSAKTEMEIWQALHTFAVEKVGAKLFTFTKVDLDRNAAIRFYTSDEVAYPVTGEKPVHRDDWFDHVCEKDNLFVANKIADIADVFPDYDLINFLGCQSVINIPVRVCGRLIGTANLLHEENYYTDERVQRAETELRQAARIAALAVSFVENQQ